MTQNEVSLLDLCTICYTEKPKYRCPRCKTQTCSLLCYKRHQQRASCNGQRDPAAYLKKSQLATPAGIDQDYNYLKGVERQIDHANRNAVERGIGDRSFASKSFHRGVHPEGALQRYLNANRICVNRAPTGMHRQKTNHTRSTKRGNIMWTVEWIDNEGVRELQENSLESSTIRELHDLRQVEKMNSTKRKLAAQSSQAPHQDASTKRQRQNDATPTTLVAELTNPSMERNEPSVQGPEASQDSQPPSNSSINAANPTPTTHDHYTGTADHASSGSLLLDLHPQPEPNPADLQPQPELKSPPNQDSNEAQLFFYLLKPNTPSRSTVLIPLSPTASLTASLSNQVVQEYPTIYALAQAPDALSSGFTTESQYLASRKAEDAELDAALRQARTQGVGVGPAPTHATANASSASGSARNDVDPHRILDMLKRDAGL